MTMLTAAAIIGKVKWQDDFNRTVGGTIPWASTDWGPDWTINYVRSGYTTWIDGSEIRVGPLGYAEGFPIDQSLKYIEQGFVQFDCYVPADIYDARPYYWVTQGGRYAIGVEVYDSTGPAWGFGIYYNGYGVDAYTVFAPTPSTWYRVKGVWSGERGGLLGIKVWKRSDPEPSSFNAVGDIGVTANPQENTAYWGQLRAYVSSSTAEDGRFDNLVYMDYGAPLDLLKYATLTAGAIKSRTMPTRLFVVDAWLAALSFSAGAWIIGGRSGHSRLLDHHGTQPDTAVVLDGEIGPYASGSTVHYVLSDLIARVAALEGGNHVVLTFTSGAFIQPYLWASAVIFKTMTVHVWNNNLPFPFKADAVLVRGRTDQLITLDAVVIRSPETTFGAGAYLIDLVC